MKLLPKRGKILVFILFFLLVLSLNLFQKGVREFFYSVSSPIQKAFWQKGAGLSDFFESIFRAGILEKENREFNRKVRELFFVQNSLKELEEENSALREALNLGLQKEFRLELAEITGKSAGEDSVIIDKGSRDGILKGLLVITAQKVLIGQISEVYQNYSKVFLISNKKTSFEVQLSGTKVSGLVRGLGGLKILLDLVPRNDEIKEGDLVIVKDFPVGLIKEVKKVDTNPFQQAEISPFFDISDLDDVFIVLD